MDRAGPDEREYAIVVSAVADADGAGFTGRVVVQRMPEGRELLREDVLTGGRTWVHRRNALAAAYMRGRQFVHFDLSVEVAERWAGIDPVRPVEPDEPSAWPPSPDHAPGPSEMARPCEL